MIELISPASKINSNIYISGSKSISNRMLVLNSILNLNLHLQNLSTSEDTELLQKAIKQIKIKKNKTIHVNHAGSDFRFLTALLSITDGTWILSGSERLKQRPIGELVSALKQLGASITYLEKDNFPPLKITGKKLDGGKLSIPAGISSQFISAVLLISPTFKNGLQLTLKGKIVSAPYIKMTVDLLKLVGQKVNYTSKKISVKPTKIISTYKINYKIESDWSSASYWYSVCALSTHSKIKLTNFNKNSLQADSVLPRLFNSLGVKTVFKKNTIKLSNKKVSLTKLKFDFTNCPDIAQTLAVVCFAKGIEAKLTGLQTLKLKETDRIQALKIELEKFGACVLTTKNSLTIKKVSSSVKSKKIIDTKIKKDLFLETYHDHRMAMAFAPLSLIKKSIFINDETVISKSYPQFWDDLKSVGFTVNLQTK